MAENNERLKYTTYFAHPMEHAKGAEIQDQLNIIHNELEFSCLGIYDPDLQEPEKVGRTPKKQGDYIKRLKQGGHWDIFYSELWKIWLGDIEENSDVLQVLSHLRMLKHVNGNRRSDFKYWGDFEAVIRSDFIIVYFPNVKTVGTHWEILIAALFRIPVYCILPDRPKTEANSTMIFGVEKLSRGKIFYSSRECCRYIIETYKLNKKPLEIKLERPIEPPKGEDTNAKENKEI